MNAQIDIIVAAQFVSERYSSDACELTSC